MEAKHLYFPQKLQHRINYDLAKKLLFNEKNNLAMK